MAGRIEVPNLICQKELELKEVGEKVVPVVVKKGVANQKFRIPFKNKGTQDLDIEFSFLRQGEGQSPVEFQAVPSGVKIQAGANGILNVSAKLKNSYQLAAKEEEPQEKYHHLLIGKVKDTQVMFSFIVEASVIKSSGGQSFS